MSRLGDTPRVRRPALAIVGSVVAIGAAVAIGQAAVGGGADPTPVNLATPGGPVSVPGDAIDVVAKGSLTEIGSVGKQTFFLGEGTTSGYECLVVAEPPETSSIGCGPRSDIEQHGLQMSQTLGDGTNVGAILLPAGARSVRIGDEAIDLVGGRVATFTTKVSTTLTAETDSGSMEVPVDAVPRLTAP